MTKTNGISFHPKLAAALDVLLGAVMLWWLRQANVWWILLLWFVFRELLWFGLSRLVFYAPGLSRLRHLLTLTLFNLGVLALLLFVEWNWAWRVTGILFVLLPAVSFYLLPAQATELSFMSKPHRRWRFIMSVAGLFGLWTGVGAVNTFQIFYGIGIWFWLVLLSVISAAIAWWWWQEYGVARERRLLVWAVVWCLGAIELSWALILWPVGFLVYGFLLTWFWYLPWLLVRFHLSPEGINWKKQRPFFFINLILLIAFLILVARWR